jgi:hypothetical protein
MDTNKRGKKPDEKRVENDRDKKSANHEKILGNFNSLHFQKLIRSFIDLKADHLINGFPRIRVKSWTEINNLAVMKLFIVGLPFEIGNLIGHSITKYMSVALLQGLLPNVCLLDSCKSSNGILKERVGAMEEAQIHQLIERIGELIHGKDPGEVKVKRFPTELIISTRSALWANGTNDQLSEEAACCAFLEALMGDGYYSLEELLVLLDNPNDSNAHTALGEGVEGPRHAGVAAIVPTIEEDAASPQLLEQNAVENIDIFLLLLAAEKAGTDCKSAILSYIGLYNSNRLQTGSDNTLTGTLPDKCHYSSLYNGENRLYPVKVLKAGTDDAGKERADAPYKDYKTSIRLHTGSSHATTGSIPDKCQYRGILGLFSAEFKDFIDVSEVEKVLRSEIKLSEGSEWGTPCKNFFQQNDIVSFNRLFNIEKMIVTESSISNIVNIFEMNTHTSWLRINNITLLRILLVGDKYQLQCYIYREFNELMALQILKLLAPKVLMNNEYHSLTWVRILGLCTYSDTYEGGRDTLITVIGTLINRAAKESFPMKSVRIIRDKSLEDFMNSYEFVRHWSLTLLEEFVNKRKYLSDDEMAGHAELIIEEFSKTYDSSDVNCSTSITTSLLPVLEVPIVSTHTNTKVAFAVQKERTVETTEEIDSMIISEGQEVITMLKSRPLDRSLTLYQNFQDYKGELAVIPADLTHQKAGDGRDVRAKGYALAAVVSSLPAKVTPPVFGFGGVTENAVKSLSARGSYFRFKAKAVAKPVSHKQPQMRGNKRKHNTGNSDDGDEYYMRHIDACKFDGDDSLINDKSGLRAIKSREWKKRWEARRKLSEDSLRGACKVLKLVNDCVSDEDLSYYSWEDQPRAEVVFKMMNIAISAIYNSRRETWKRRKRK